MAKVSLVLRDALRCRKPAKALSSHSLGASWGVASWEWAGGSTSSEDKFKKLAAESQKSCLQRINEYEFGGMGVAWSRGYGCGLE